MPLSAPVNLLRVRRVVELKHVNSDIYFYRSYEGDNDKSCQHHDTIVCSLLPKGEIIQSERELVN